MLMAVRSPRRPLAEWDERNGLTICPCGHTLKERGRSRGASPVARISDPRLSMEGEREGKEAARGPVLLHVFSQPALRGTDFRATVTGQRPAAWPTKPCRSRVPRQHVTAEAGRLQGSAQFLAPHSAPGPSRATNGSACNGGRRAVRRAPARGYLPCTVCPCGHTGEAPRERPSSLSVTLVRAVAQKRRCARPCGATGVRFSQGVAA